jgi:hypothetical protein
MTSSSTTSNARKISAFDSLLAGSASGMAAVLVCHPLDLIRTKMQIQHTLSISQAFKASWSEGGIKSLYKGFSMPFVAQVGYKSIIFVTNTLSQQYLFTNSTSYISMFLSGTIAGSVNGLVVAPVEIVRTTQIMSKGADGTGQMPVSQAIRHIYQHRGFGGFWMTLLPTIIRDGPGIGLYLIAFDKTKKWLLSQGGYDSKTTSCPVWMRLVAGSFAGIAFWTWGMPIDSLKTRIESSIKAHGHNMSIAEIVKQQIRGVKLIELYRALPVAYVRGIPSAAVTLTTYDLCLEYLLRS